MQQEQDEIKVENSTTDTENGTTQAENIEITPQYELYSKEELIATIEQLAQGDDTKKALQTARLLKPHYDAIVKEEKKEALQKFLDDGGEETEFDYKQIESESNRFYKEYQNIISKRNKEKLQKEKERDKNLVRKKELLEKLRNILESEDTPEAADEFKKIQEEWKTIGGVPQKDFQELKATYNALIERFYDKRSIYFELKELDRKKNLELKIALIEKAEKLIEITNTKQAIQEFKEIRKEYIAIGPVLKEEQENIKIRFKQIADALFERRRALLETLKGEREKNLVTKQALLEEVKAFSAFQSDRIKEWNNKTQELLELQKTWDNIRPVPRQQGREIGREFWAAFKAFFAKKTEFFKGIESEREDNLQKKIALCEQAEALLASEEEQNAVAEKFKQLQKDWKTIGPAPARVKDTVYERFKKACDAFFQKIREQQTEEDKQQVDNLQKKQAICENILNYTFAENATKKELEEVATQFAEEWKKIGYVPLKNKKGVEKDFEKAMMSLAAKIEAKTEEDKMELEVIVEAKIARTATNNNRGGNNSGGGRASNREIDLKKQIDRLENEIATLRNNLGFFANSKQADTLKSGFEKQMQEATDKLAKLKMQLKILRKK
ncbi:MAG: DUF349 domain-containing protein [Cytophagales bacterium]|nr:MAG: DUF349 domain-containing protein [Cytophagales bacterium]